MTSKTTEVETQTPRVLMIKTSAVEAPPKVVKIMVTKVATKTPKVLKIKPIAVDPTENK